MHGGNIHISKDCWDLTYLYLTTRDSDNKEFDLPSVSVGASGAQMAKENRSKSVDQIPYSESMD